MFTNPSPVVTSSSSGASREAAAFSPTASPGGHSPDFVNCSMQTGQPRPTARSASPSAAVVLPFP